MNKLIIGFMIPGKPEPSYLTEYGWSTAIEDAKVFKDKVSADMATDKILKYYSYYFPIVFVISANDQ